MKGSWCLKIGNDITIIRILTKMLKTALFHEKYPFQPFYTLKIHKVGLCCTFSLINVVQCALVGPIKTIFRGNASFSPFVQILAAVMSYLIFFAYFSPSHTFMGAIT